jgi:purine-nucleoside phosphorylase
MNDIKRKVDEAAAAVREKCDRRPEIGIILGTGLGDLAAAVEGAVAVPYEEIPGLPASDLAAHAGRFVLGVLEGKPVVVMDGRYHLYEGWTLEQVTMPVRIMRALGAETLVVSNAAGGMNPLHEVGDIVVIDDHIGLFGPNVLAGPNDPELGPRFPDMCRPYDPELLKMAEEACLAEGVRAHRGVYVWVTGPTLETRAEYRMLRLLGADVVGMSTVPEVVVAVHGGMRVLGFSVVTDRCLPDALCPAKIEEIIAVAGSSGAKLARVIRRVVREM